MHIQNTGVRLKHRPPVVHTALTSAFQLFAEVRGPTITLTFKALKVNSVLYLFIFGLSRLSRLKDLCVYAERTSRSKESESGKKRYDLIC